MNYIKRMQDVSSRMKKTYHLVYIVARHEEFSSYMSFQGRYFTFHLTQRCKTTKSRVFYRQKAFKPSGIIYIRY